MTVYVLFILLVFPDGSTYHMTKALKTRAACEQEAVAAFDIAGPVMKSYTCKKAIEA